MRPLSSVLLSILVAIPVLLVVGPAFGQTEWALRRPVVVLQEGDVVPGMGGRTVECLSGPASAGGDDVGMVALLSDGEEGALWVGHHRSGPTHLVLGRDAGALQFVPLCFGVGAGGREGATELPYPFVVKAILRDSTVALLTGWGAAQMIGGGAPGLPEAAVVTGVDRITMLANGQAYWVGNWQHGGTSGRALFRRGSGVWGRVEMLLNTGDVVCDGRVVSLRHFRVAHDGTLGQVVDLRTVGGDRRVLHVDGTCPYAVGRALPGTAERLTDLGFFDLNSGRHVLLGATTDGPSCRNAVFALDGKVVMREGDVIDGVRIQPPEAEPNQVRLDDRGRALTLWAGPAASCFTIFYTPDITRFSTTRKLVSENTPLDFDGDGVADANLFRFRFFPYSGPTFSLGETGVHIAVWLTYPGSNRSVAAVIFYPL